MMVFFLIKFMKNIVAKKYSGSQSNPDTGLIFSIPTLYHLFNFRLILEYLLWWLTDWSNFANLLHLRKNVESIEIDLKNLVWVQKILAFPLAGCSILHQKSTALSKLYDTNTIIIITYTITLDDSTTTATKTK